MTLLRLHLLDKCIEKWSEKSYQPYCFTFGLQATPVKPYDDVMGERRALHIDCFKKVESDYYTFLFGPSPDDPQITVFDRIEKLGVNTLILHEKWNVVQNYWKTSNEVKTEIKAIVEEAHLRGMKVLPYFGYELASSAPEYASMADEVLVKSPKGMISGGWYRKPYQRDFKVCYNSIWQDKLVEGIKEVLDYFGFDGVYLDSTAHPHACYNQLHGCGYKDEQGYLHPTYPVLAVRKLMRRLYSVIHPKRGIINPHQSENLASPILSFTHLCWDGETLAYPFNKKGIEGIPLDYCRTQFDGRKLGVPIEFLVYEYPGKWTFDQALALCLINGVLPRPNDIGKPLASISKVWDILNCYGPRNAKWQPYWERTNSVKSSDVNIKISYYEKKMPDEKKQILAFISNPSVTSVSDATIDFLNIISNTANATVTNAKTGHVIHFKDGCITVSLKEYEYIIAYIYG